MSVNSLDGTNGFAIISSSLNTYLGYSVSGLGDVNEDGIADIVLGAPQANGGLGNTYVIYGRRTPFPASFNVNLLDGIKGFAIAGSTSTGLAGYSVTIEGDYDDDGIDDIVVAAPNTKINGGDNTGHVCLFYGRTVCGNALLEGKEECDDGNANSNDGCSSSCGIETGYSCSSIGASCLLCNPGCSYCMLTGPERCDSSEYCSSPKYTFSPTNQTCILLPCYHTSCLVCYQDLPNKCKTCMDGYLLDPLHHICYSASSTIASSITAGKSSSLLSSIATSISSAAAIPAAATSPGSFGMLYMISVNNLISI